MKIHIKNIGMLDEADFEVGDLTLICGENNTGKTYATYSLYGYLDFVNSRKGMNFSIFYSLIDRYSRFIKIQDYKIQMNIEVFKNIFENVLETLKYEYENILPEVLSGKTEDFKKSIFKHECDPLLEFSNFKQNTNDEEQQKKISKFFRSYAFRLCEINEKTISFSYENNKELNNVSNYFLVAFVSYILSIICPKPFILSAERTGAAMFQKELDINKNEIIEKIATASGKNVRRTVFDVLNTRYSRYPKPVNDNIYFVRELSEITKKTSFIKKGEKENVLYEEIIKLLHQVVGGKYVVSLEGIEFAPGAKQRITKGKFLVQRASSSVRSLLMLNYYILYVAQVGDILMIDEPELNLHPNNQILIARLFALLVNAGIKVFITTHSDYIVRELSNCIMLKNLSENQIQKFKKRGYSNEYSLESKKVKAYLAENIKGKNTLKEVKITQEQGIFIKTFDEPIYSQNDNQGSIFEEFMRNKRNKDD